MSSNNLSINDYDHFHIDLFCNEVFISYPLGEHIWNTYNGHSSRIGPFLRNIVSKYIQACDSSIDFNINHFKWFIYDDDVFKGHSFKSVLDSYWFEEEISLSQFLNDHIIRIDTNTSSVPSEADWETNSTLGNFSTIQVDNSS